MSVRDNVAFGLTVRPRAERPARRRSRRGLQSCSEFLQIPTSARPLPRAALRRPAAARGARPGARDRAEGAAARRALRRARRRDPPRPAALAARSARRDRIHHHLRHPRPGRGFRARRPRGGHGRGPDRADRSCRPDPRPPREPLRRPLHGRHVELPVTLHAGRALAPGLDLSRLPRRALADGDGPALRAARRRHAGAGGRQSPGADRPASAPARSCGWSSPDPTAARSSPRSPAARAAPRRSSPAPASTPARSRPPRFPRRVRLTPRRRPSLPSDFPQGDRAMTFPTVRGATVALALAAQPAAAQETKSAQRELRHRPRALRGDQPRLCRPLAGDRPGRTVTIDQSHGGSSRQARAILEGLQADVVTFNQETDVARAADRGGLLPRLARALPNNASPYYSLPAFLVREGNPKNIQDWSDLVRDDVQPSSPTRRPAATPATPISPPSPSRSRRTTATTKAKEFVRQAIFANVPVFDTGGRAATTDLRRARHRRRADHLRGRGPAASPREYGAGLRAVTPSISLFAAFPVSGRRENVERNGTTRSRDRLSRMALHAGGTAHPRENFYRVHRRGGRRPNSPSSSPRCGSSTVDEVFGGWEQATRASTSPRARSSTRSSSTSDRKIAVAQRPSAPSASCRASP
jgi:sulfate/thiosulfate transport system substrate-binding protein